MNFLDLLYLIPLFPLAGFAVNGLFGKRLGPGFVNAVGCGSALLAFVFSCLAVLQLVE